MALFDVARAEVDLRGGVACQVEDGLLAEASVAASDEDDFAREGGDVLGGIEWDGFGEERREGEGFWE